jgi:hypothetical protein
MTKSKKTKQSKPFKKSNFSIWQVDKVDSRKKEIVSILKDLKIYKSSIVGVTDLSKSIIEKLEEVEASQRGSETPAHRLNPSTLLRRKGPYRILLDNFLLERDGVGSYFMPASDAVGERVLSSYRTKLQVSAGLVARLQNRIESLEKYTNAHIAPHGTQELKLFERSQVDAMGKVATIFFQLLLSTDYCKYDEVTGDVLAISRARKVLVPASELSVYLNWRFHPVIKSD